MREEQPDRDVGGGWLDPRSNPYSAIAALLVVRSKDDHGWIADVNRLCCDLVGWERGRFGDPYDPECATDTLIGKPLDVLVPPMFREAHRKFREAFVLHPIPRTMGEGRNTPIWIRKPGIRINGLDSIAGVPSTVLIGLSALDEVHTLAMIQPMNIGKSFSLPHTP